MVPDYEPQEIEKKWQARWAEDELYRVSETDDKPKWYFLTMFPYTSGDLHIGHWYAEAPADTAARFKRMQGYNVLHPIGFDAFGLPAENAAIKRNIHPFTWTIQNVENMRKQLKSLGASYDWSRELVTCLPEYYKWTEWFFLQLFKAGLAYRAKAPANWCPTCQTVLANEQVTDDGLCERCESLVTKRHLEQWFLRITRYADELLDHSKVQWPERIALMQKNWIGRSEGAEISFGIEGYPDEDIRVFTTRPDTAYGVTFMVFAPEHPLVERLTTPEQRAEVDAYMVETRRQSEIERLSTEKEKTGVFTGAYALNRLNGEKVPIFIADYVLLSYGTGAVMAVPAHDTRDFAFAKKYGLPIPVVIAPEGWSGEPLSDAYTEAGAMVNSGPFDGTSSLEGKKKVAQYLKDKGLGGPTVNYRLRDWLISRQRYWGAPIPIVYCDKCGIVPVPEDQLPVLLPEDAEFRPTGESPLKYHEAFVNATCPTCGGPARRETDTMDTFICSSWYFLRYSSPGYDKGPFDPAKVKYWLPVDQYTGGAEHACMHLLYARFFTMALRDLGLIEFGEPFTRLFNQGVIIADSRKMSKSRGNVINPDLYVRDIGADTVRAYLMFIGPWDQGGDWNDNGIGGMFRFMNRVWHLVLAEDDFKGKSLGEASEAEVRELRRFTHRTIKKVSEDLEKFRFNTMLAALMEFTNYLTKARDTAVVNSPYWQEAIDSLILLMAPATPHITEELWTRTGHAYSVHNQSFPVWDEALVKEDEITLVVQVNGKLRDRMVVPASISEEEAKSLALQMERVQPFIQSREIKNVFYVSGRLVNIVVS
ncbi:MAG: leucine--tRNA ligase [Dehalococcoidia bacterium]|nr:leucine--tRNA ligase [Dehalococcoidia bacterium]